MKRLIQNMIKEWMNFRGQLSIYWILNKSVWLYDNCLNVFLLKLIGYTFKNYHFVILITEDEQRKS